MQHPEAINTKPRDWAANTQAAFRQLCREEHPHMENVDNMEIGSLTHAIIKSVKEENQMHLIAIARRLQYCCLLEEEEEARP